jgi:redox-sensitive bicupin YhaK (pirin superfamily)
LIIKAYEESWKEWNRRMIALRRADEIYEIFGEIENGTLYSRWHFSFGAYNDPRFIQFGPLCVFNDDTLSPGARWLLQPHSGIEVVTYCVDGREAGGELHKGWVQRITVGSRMVHSEINDRVDEWMRFIQMWFIPSTLNLEPDVQQKRVEREERSNRFLALVSNQDAQALTIHADAEVYASYLQRENTAMFAPRDQWGGYLYLLEGGPILVNGRRLAALDAVMATNEKQLYVTAELDAELLLIHVPLTIDPQKPGEVSDVADPPNQ